MCHRALQKHRAMMDQGQGFVITNSFTQESLCSVVKPSDLLSLRISLIKPERGGLPLVRSPFYRLLRTPLGAL
jgi:hypothetical protein